MIVRILQRVGTHLYSSTGSCHTGGYDPLVFSILTIGAIFRRLSMSPCVSPTGYAINDMFFITSSHDS